MATLQSPNSPTKSHCRLELGAQCHSLTRAAAKVVILLEPSLKGL